MVLCWKVNFVPYPMYDKNRLIPRGKLVDIPTQPIPKEITHTFCFIVKLGYYQYKRTMISIDIMRKLGGVRSI